MSTTQPPAGSPPGPAGGPGTFRLSPQQARAARSVGAARARAVVDLDGAVSAEAVERALDALVARHEILRTSFPTPAGMRAPLQAVHDDLPPSWSVVEVAPDADPAAPATSEAAVAVAAPGLTATLLTRAGTPVALVLETAALALDRWSWRQVVADLAALVAGDAAGLAADPLPYVDFAEWQHELVESDEQASAAAAFWAGLELGAAAAAPLPFEQPVAPDPTRRRRVPVPAAPEACAAVTALAGRLGVTADVVWTAAWAVVLERLTAAGSVTFGVLADARDHEDLDGTVGLFGRVLPVRLRWDAADAAPTFAELVDRTRRAVTAARRWQDFVPLAGADAVPAVRSTVAVVAPEETIAHGDVRWTIRHASGGEDSAAVGLELASPDGSDVVHAALAHDPSALSTAAVARLAAAVAAVVAGAVDDPHEPVVQLPLGTGTAAGAAGDAAVAAANATGRPGTTDRLVPERLAEAARVHADRPAVRAADATLTHGELGARAAALAARLRRLGVAPGTVVGLCLDRTAEAVVGLVGILWAGGAYLPLHPEHPAGRLDLQLTDAGAPVVVTSAALAERVAGAGRTVVALDADELPPTADLVDLAAPAVGADDLAYVIYTSGSTGVPKGVAVTHGNLANYTSGLIDRLVADGVDPTAEALVFGSVSALSTDLGNTAIFPALTTGGCLDLVAQDDLMDPQRYAAHVAAHPVDVLKITPSHLGALLASEGDGVLPRRLLVTGGEALTWDLAERILAAGRCGLVNHYGPTETTIGSCTATVTVAPAGAWRPATVPIGRPIANTRAHVVDPAGRPVPVGFVGELGIAGAGVAQGYLGQPEQTAERFVAEPAGAGRMYRTGDLARWLEDGTIEFLGRSDQQIKIRGHRVEPAEVEAALLRQPAVTQAAVVARPDATGGLRLVAYVVGPAATSVDELRRGVAGLVPDHMVPTAIVTLASLPVTASGKVDRLALPEPDERGVTSAAVAPRTPLEEQVAAIWAEVLGRETVGVTDNFFSLGGHSLLATRVIARVRAELAVAVPLHALFTAPTVEGLAAAVAGLQGGADEDDIESLLAELDSMSDEEAEALLADS